MGTWNTAQNGQTLRMTVNAHTGFNAQTGQLASTDLILTTSNGSSANANSVGGNFFGVGTASYNTSLGSNFSAPGIFRIVQSNSTTYLIYAFFAAFMDNSQYSVYVNPGTNWVNSSTLTAEPFGTYINVFPGGYTYTENTISAQNVAIPQTVDLASFTLQAPGTWKITYIVRAEQTTSNSRAIVFLSDNSNNEISNSRVGAPRGVANLDGTVTGIAYLTVGTTPATYKVRCTVINNQVNILSDTNGLSKVIYERMEIVIP